MPLLKRAFLALFLLASNLGALGQESPEVPIKFEVLLVVPSKVPFTGTIVLEPEAHSNLTPRNLEVSESKVVLKTLPAGSVWRVEGQAPGFWIKRFSVQIAAKQDDPPQKIELSAWPMGVVSGRLSRPAPTKGSPSQKASQATPKTLTLTTLPVRNGARHLAGRSTTLQAPTPAPPKGEILCPVESSGQFRCELPAASYDLALAQTPFVPLYRWDVRIAPGQVTDLGKLRLVEGSSIAGWVLHAEGVLDPALCRVKVTPYRAPNGRTLQEIEKDGSRQREVKINPQGFFQIVGVPVGTYSIQVEQGLALAEPRAPIEVTRDAETYLAEPFRIEAPLDLEVEMVPALDWFGKPWTLAVERFFEIGTTKSEEVFRGRTGFEGRARVQNLRRGQLSVEVSDSTGRRVYRSSAVPLRTREDSRLVIEIDGLEISGRVRLNGEPLVSKLWFGGKQGPTSILVETDPEGRIASYLPRGGHWRIDFESEQPPITLTLHRVIEKKDGKGRIHLEIPNTRLFGRALRSDGRPAQNVLVSLLEQEGASQSTVVDSQGNFEFLALAPGAVSLGAETEQGDLASTEQQVIVETTDETGPIVLTLEPKRRFSGRVLSTRGLEPRAAVFLVGEKPLRIGNARALTALDGSFNARLPAEIEVASVVVGVQGAALTVFELAAESPRDLFVTAAGGILEVNLGPKAERLLAEDALALRFYQNGLELPGHIVSAWARARGELWLNGHARRIPDLAPANYTVCLTGLSARFEQLRSRGQLGGKSECASGQLAAAGIVVLQIDEGSDPNAAAVER